MDTSTIAIISSVGSAVVAVIATLIYVGMRPKAYPAGPFVEKALDYLSIVNWFKILYYFLPYGLFLFGIIYDGLVQKIKFFPAGFIALLAVYVNSVVSGMLGKGTVDTDICGIPGMSKWGSEIAPQNIVFVSAILSYIAMYMSINPGFKDEGTVAPSWIGYAVVSIAQMSIFAAGDCATSKPWFGGKLATISALAIGSLFGIAGGGLIGKYVNVGSGVSDIGQQKLVGGTSAPAMAPTTNTVGAGTCSPTDSDDQFVCEAYKNGELVTSTIVE